MSEPLQAVKGMNDILPPESARWEWFEEKVRALMRRYGYQNMRTPVVEPTQLFVRGLGDVTDIVEKEMYSWVDAMNGDQLTLRPEATAGLVRAAIHGTPWQACLAPMSGFAFILFTFYMITDPATSPAKPAPAGATPPCTAPTRQVSTPRSRRWRRSVRPSRRRARSRRSRRARSRRN